MIPKKQRRLLELNVTVWEAYRILVEMNRIFVFGNKKELIGKTL